MTLLCIGKSGQVAMALAERAHVHDVECVCIGRPQLDLRDRNRLKRTIEIVRPDFVINAAAYTAVDAAEHDQDSAFAVNTDGAGTLAKLCADQDLPLLHLSTDYVFDGTSDQAYREDDVEAPINVYGASKRAGESAIRDHHHKHIILRTSWIYSPFGTNFVKTMLRVAKEKGVASVVDDQVGSPTSALDIADTILQIALRIPTSEQRSIFGTYHYTADGTCSWADVAAVVFETYELRTGCKIRLNRIASSDYPTPAKRPLNSKLDTTKIEQAFDVRPKDWVESVQKTVNRLIDEGL